MSALQIWLQHHYRRLSQEAIDEALMEYIEKIERENAQLRAAIEAQWETVRLQVVQIDNQSNTILQQSALIETLAGALNSKYVVMCGAWQVERDEALAAYELWRMK